MVPLANGTDSLPAESWQQLHIDNAPCLASIVVSTQTSSSQPAQKYWCIVYILMVYIPIRELLLQVCQVRYFPSSS